MKESEKITIVEGPPPTFVLTRDAWLLGLIEGMVSFHVAHCRVRTLNGPALVERCHTAWGDGQSVELEYRGDDGLTRQAPIVAVRLAEVEEGDMLYLWVRLEEDDVEVELDLEGFEFDEYDDEDDEPGTDYFI